jgi:hypothetical protein
MLFHKKNGSGIATPNFFMSAISLRLSLSFLFVALTTLGRSSLLGFMAGDAELVGISLFGETLYLSTLVVLVTDGAALETLCVLLVVEGYVSGVGSRQHLDIFCLHGGSEE